jgi:predicted MFS family arabinose efflux permease
MRFFIGIGEAGCLVIGPTLLSAIFPKEVRGKALSVFFLALPLGGTAGYIVGGILTKMLGWQYAFFFAGLPGFLVAALIWFLADPPREGTTEGAHGTFQGIRPYLELLRNRTLLFIILAQAFAVMFLQPLLLYGVGFFEAERGFGKIQATTTLGVIALVSGSAGNMLSGVIGDLLARRRKGAYALLAGIAFTAGLPFLLLGFTSHVRWIMLPALGVGAFCYFLCMPAVNTQIANAVTAPQRAMAYALAVFILHFLGDTGAPPAFGAAESALGGKQPAFTVFSFSLLLAGASCFIAARTAARDEERATATASPPSSQP